MKQILPLITTVALLTACSQAQNTETNNTSGLCDSLLMPAVKTAIADTQNLKVKYSDPEIHKCGVSFKLGSIDYQINFQQTEIGTANDKKDIGKTGIIKTNYQFQQTVVSFYKDNEEIADVGQEAVYYNRGGSYEVYVLTGDDAFTLQTINWNTRGGDKDITINVAKIVANQLKNMNYLQE